MNAQTTHATLLNRLSEQENPAAWGEFYERYGDLIRSFARKQGLQAADRDDVLQDVMTSLTRSMPRFRYDPSRGKFRSYLKTVTIRAIVRRRNQDRRRTALEDIESQIHEASRDDALDAIWEQSWRLHHVKRAMRRIEQEFNREDRAAFAEYAVAGKDARVTASALDMSVEQVWQAKSRVLKRLTQIIEEQVRHEG